MIRSWLTKKSHYSFSFEGDFRPWGRSSVLSLSLPSFPRRAACSEGGFPSLLACRTLSRCVCVRRRRFEVEKAVGQT